MSTYIVLLLVNVLVSVATDGCVTIKSVQGNTRRVNYPLNVRCSLSAAEPTRLGKLRYVWEHNGVVICNSSQPVAWSSRVKCFDNSFNGNDLLIRQLVYRDEGEYRCLVFAASYQGKSPFLTIRVSDAIDFRPWATDNKATATKATKKPSTSSIATTTAQYSEGTDNGGRRIPTTSATAVTDNSENHHSNTVTASTGSQTSMSTEVDRDKNWDTPTTATSVDQNKQPTTESTVALSESGSLVCMWIPSVIVITAVATLWNLY